MKIIVCLFTTAHLSTSGTTAGSRSGHEPGSMYLRSSSFQNVAFRAWARPRVRQDCCQGSDAMVPQLVTTFNDDRWVLCPGVKHPGLRSLARPSLAAESKNGKLRAQRGPDGVRASSTDFSYQDTKMRRRLLEARRYPWVALPPQLLRASACKVPGPAALRNTIASVRTSLHTETQSKPFFIRDPTIRRNPAILGRVTKSKQVPYPGNARDGICLPRPLEEQRGSIYKVRELQVEALAR